ncbi:MAG TPA: DUF420 domain-containing protein [Thermoanaerobaculia bacterium]|nr:DUF420 domain-containing protein [Thermoanaerobaculia bacterium]
MEWLKILPAVNATLNATSGALIVTGYLLIRRKNIAAHRRAMLAACACSVIFLASYLFYHYHAGATRFTGTGWTRPLYFTILGSHTILAMVIVPLVILSVYNGLKNRVPQHRRVAKWTYPLWLYVSITGVLVYFFLYHWFP